MKTNNQKPLVIGIAGAVGSGKTFKGNIYITDPSYIALIEDWMERFDHLVESIDCPEFSDAIIRSTGIGDGRWRVYEPRSIDNYTYSSICTLIKKGDYNDCNVIGEFCVDSASACVVYQLEADKYNPLFMAEFKDKPHCWALIDDFNGEVETYYDNDGEFHFIGIGNRCFFTA